MLLLTPFLRFPWEDEDKPLLYIFQQDTCLSSTQLPVPLQGIDAMCPDLQDKDYCCQYT